MAFSENLQFIRSQAGVTQEQLAEQLGVSRQSVSKWESGASFPEMDTLLRLCDLYDVNLDTLLRGSVEQSRVGDTARYDAHMNGFALQVSLAVCSIIAGLALTSLLKALALPSMPVTAGFMLILTVSVVVLVAGGIRHDLFRKKHPVIQDFYTEEEKDAFHQKFVWYIAGGVGAILFGIVLLVLTATLLPEESRSVSVAGSGFLLLVAGAVFFFIYGGMQEEKYKIWKYNRDNDPAPEAKRRLDQTGAACGVIMLLATAVYLALGFTRDAWTTAWWVFPVGCVLCAAVSVVLDPYKGDD